jgi:hypothetical protein
MEQLLTLGLMAEQLGCPAWKVDYLLRSRGIKPIQRAGHLRIFSSEVVETLRRELDAMGQKREQQRCTG